MLCGDKMEKQKIIWCTKAGHFVFLLLVILISPHSSFAQENITTQNPISVESKIHSVPAEIIDRVNQKIIGNVGKEYFEMFFLFYESYSRKNKITHEEEFVLLYNFSFAIRKNRTGIPVQMDHQFKLVSDSAGQIVYNDGFVYMGPAKPYQFLITQQEAIDIGLNRGLSEQVKVELYHHDRSIGDLELEEGSYSWKVQKRGCVTNNSLKTIYLDVDSGDVLNKVFTNDECIKSIGDLIHGSGINNDAKARSFELNERNEIGKVSESLLRNSPGVSYTLSNAINNSLNNLLQLIFSTVILLLAAILFKKKLLELVKKLICKGRHYVKRDGVKGRF